MVKYIELAYTLKARDRKNCIVQNYKTVHQLWYNITGAQVTYNSYEYDKQKRLHCHGILKALNAVTYRSYQVKDYVVHVRPLRTEAEVLAWKLYCDKEQDEQYDSEECHIQMPTKSLFHAIRVGESKPKASRGGTPNLTDSPILLTNMKFFRYL